MARLVARVHHNEMTDGGTDVEIVVASGSVFHSKFTIMTAQCVTGVIGVL